ncbi:tetratricopeptide repeat protein [bacterium]|nr:tetratricopeptide repeat protein [bacterium]
MSKRTGAAVLLLGMIWMSCGSTGSVNIRVQKAAAVDMPGVHTIAIVDFKGPEGSGSQIATMVQSKLMETGHFNIMEREKISALLSEQNLGMTGIVDPSTAAEIGAMLGVDAMIFGEVTAYKIEPDKQVSKKVKEKQFTGKYKTVTKKDKNGKQKTVKEKIYEDVWVTKSYWVRQGNVDVNFRVVNVKTGALLAAHSDSESYDSQEGKSEYSLLNSTQSNLEPPGKILSDLAEKVCRRFVFMISPHVVSEQRVIESGKEGIARGKKLAEAGLWPEAMEAWRKSAKNFPKEPASFYNLGLAYEVQGDLDQAEELYKEALSLKSKDLYMQALARIRKSKADRARLEQQLENR